MKLSFAYRGGAELPEAASMFCNANHIIMTKCEIIPQRLLALCSSIKWALMEFDSSKIQNCTNIRNLAKDNHCV